MMPAGTAGASGCRAAAAPAGVAFARGLAALAIACCLPVVAHSAAAAPVPAPCKRFESAVQKADTPAPRDDDRGFDVLSYDLDLTIDPAPGPTAGLVALTGRVDIGLVAVQADVDTLVLDLVPQLICDSVTRGGRPLTFARAGEELHVAIPGGLATAAPETLTIAWHGRPPRHGNLYAGMMVRGDDAGTPTDTSDDTPLVFTVSEPWSAHAWWPCKDHPADKAQVSLAATMPADLTAIGNGSLESVADVAPGWRRFRWRELYPLPTYLVSVAASRYVSWSEDCRPAQADPVALEFHVLERERTAAETLFANTCAMMDFLTGRLGPYPFAGEKYAQVEVIWGGAMEHTTATSIGQFMFTGDGRYENVVLHELAHQWFGDSLTPARWADIWLNEGFATYAEALWVEQTQGPEALEAFMRLIGPGRHPDLFVGNGTLSDPSPVLPNTLVYDKGAWVLHMLRGVIGDEAFFRFLRDYAGDPALAQGLVTSGAMIARAEATAGRGLGGFFGPWVETEAVPQVRLEPLRRGSRPGGGAVRLRQLQSTLMTVPVPLTIWAGCGALSVTAVLERREQTFTWELDCPIDSVTVDARRASLAVWAEAPPPPLRVLGPAPNPVGAAGSQFKLDLNNDAHVIVKIYDTRGRLVDQADLGLLSATVSDGVGHIWRWSPPSGAGTPPSAVYWFDFRAGSARVVRRGTLIR